MRSPVASVYDLKPRFQAFLRPAMLWLRETGVTPNDLTVAAVGLSILTGVCIGLGARWPAFLLAVPPALFVRMALNAIDGMMARECNLATPEGMILNEVGDVVSDIVTFLPLAAFLGDRWIVIVIFTLLAVVCEFAGLLGVSLCGRRLYDGPMGKSDRAFAVGATALLLYICPGARAQLPAVVAMMSGMLILSIRNRLRSALAGVVPPPVP